MSIGDIFGTALNVASGAFTSIAMKKAHIDPLSTLYVDWNSSSGFGSWANSAYADPINLAKATSGFDITFAPLDNAIFNATTSIFGLSYNSSICDYGLSLGF